MENILIFIFSLAIIVAVIAVVANASVTSLYQTIQSEKKVLEFFRGDVMLFYRTDGGIIPTDHILYITRVENGEFNLVNAGVSDIYSLRVVCWKRSDPVNSIETLYAEINGTIQPISIEVLPSFYPLNTAEYNLYLYEFNQEDVENNNIVCVAAGMRFIRPFVPRA